MAKPPKRTTPAAAGSDATATEVNALREQLAEAERYIQAQATRIQQLEDDNAGFRQTLDKAVQRALQWQEVAQSYEAQLEEAYAGEEEGEEQVS